MAITGLLLAPFILNAQDIITLKDGNTINCIVTRINPDSIYSLNNYINKFNFPIDKIKNLTTSDPFKKFVWKTRNFNPETYRLDYTNYCLNRYRIQSNTGRTMMLAGACLGIGSVFIVETETYPYVGVVCGAISLIGYIVEWNSLYWLKNLSVIPEYKVGIGYTFRF